MSHHPSAGLSQARHVPTPSISAAIAAVVALLILFLWLHFFLAQEIESLGRDIEAQQAELSRVERRNQALIGQITLTESQANMAALARSMGFVPQQPVYLAISRPLAQQADPRGEAAYLSFWALQVGGLAPDGTPVETRAEATPDVEQNVADLP